ncbi:hypothetical protein [Paenibacillus hamazuiensis]|uniref:hypothetical protein n=1 Tax=Paenibacillus hamazuiensis TaxID=2936508 RepID=UPI00200BCC51|nr:hypothetical protein [Paenibacillus hamazuiensis]
MKLYFRDNFFNAGQTDILNERNERVGEVDLRSAFGSTLDIYDRNGKPLFGGKFPFMSGRWLVTGEEGEELGQLRHRLSFFNKKYEYDAFGRGLYEITSPAFSREYEIHHETGVMVAAFAKVNGFFEASAFCLENRSREIDSFEWIAVILGMHEIQKRHRSS